MGRRSCRPALLAVGLVSVALLVGRVAPSVAPVHEAIQDARSTVADAASIPDAQVGSLLVLRRFAPDGGTKSFLADLAAVVAACSAALLGARRARDRAATARTPAFVLVPCGLRAPPAARA